MIAQHSTSVVLAACPACGSASFDTVGSLATAFLCDGAARLDHPSYAIRECQDCGLHYKSHALSPQSLGDYYRSLDFTPFDADDGFPTDAVLLAHLRRLPQGSRVLDFGCSTGRILAALGATYERFGVEINEAAAREARRRGIVIVADRALDDAKTGLFDAIVLSDVFEHLVEPTETLRRLARLLGPGGRLFLVTGLADAVCPRALIAEHWYFRIGGHLHMLSRRHLDWLARKLGLEVAAVQRISHYRSVPALLARQRLQAALYGAVKLRPHSTTAALLRRLPGLNRVDRWTNLPATSQMADHVVAVLFKT